MLSGHAVPLATLVFWHPLVALHVSVVHTLLSLQLSAVPAAQMPPWQVSAPLQTVASAHGVPFRTAVFWQPNVGLQESEVQTLESLQLRVVPGAQVPDWQVSAPLQTLPSLHDVPFVTFVFTHPVVTLH